MRVHASEMDSHTEDVDYKVLTKNKHTHSVRLHFLLRLFMPVATRCAP